jgi:hypothetical protein
LGIRPAVWLQVESENDTTVPVTEDYLTYYEPVLEKYRQAVRNRSRGSDPLDLESIIVDWVGDSYSEDEFGYALKDLSGDGIPELMLLTWRFDMAFEVYSLVDFVPYLLVQSMVRAYYSVNLNGTLLLQGSNGAGNDTLSLYEISRDGTKLIFLEGLRSEEIFTTQLIEQHFYHTAGSEKEISIPEEEWISIQTDRFTAESFEEAGLVFIPLFDTVQSPEVLPIETIDIDALAKFIRLYAFPPESNTPVSEDRTYIETVLDILWFEQSGGSEADGGKYIPAQDVENKLRRVYGIEYVNHDEYGWTDGTWWEDLGNIWASGYKDGNYRYFPDDGAYYENKVTITSWSDNGDGTLTAIAEVQYGSEDADVDFFVTYPTLVVVLKPVEPSYQIISIDGRTPPKRLLDVAQP